MSLIIFQKEEANYFDWIAKHPSGFVLNTKAKLSPDYMVLHRASCKLVTGYLGKASSGGFTERVYRKVCADTVGPIKFWVESNDGFLSTCSHCGPEAAEVTGHSSPAALKMPKFAFEVGRQYDRKEVIAITGVNPVPTGGDWFTGYTSYGGASFIFCNVGSAGRTGHDYANFWNEDELEWSGKTGSRSTWDSIKTLTASDAEVHLFYRNADREPFTYAGIAKPVFVDEDAVPVRVRWRFETPSAGATEPMTSGGNQTEGGKKTRFVTTYERSGKARADCLKHYGAKCCVCELDFFDRYGDIGKGFMHVHHLKPVADGEGKQVSVDPIQDLRPVCPNCHSMLHRRKPPLSIKELLAVYSPTNQSQSAS
jgi:5-methylcytosine-specific restriction protein A